MCFNSCKRRWRASEGLQLWLAKPVLAVCWRPASCNALLVSSCSAPLKQNSDALSTFLILLLCVSKHKRGERLCDGEWDTRQSFSKDVVRDTKRVRECLSYTNIPEITGKLQQMFPQSNFPSFSSFCVWLCRSLCFLKFLLYEGLTLKCQVLVFQKATARNETLNARFLARQGSFGNRWESHPYFWLDFCQQHRS